MPKTNDILSVEHDDEESHQSGGNDTGRRDPGIKSIAIKNPNTAYKLEVSSFSTYDSAQSLGFKPNHPVSEANDAIIKYEGITITRPSNTIDDVIPEITLNVKDKTEKTATLEVKADTEASKDALIQFVGKYNQTVAKINILSQTKPEIIEELDYFTDEEKEKSHKQLGMFQTDFSLTSIKSNMQSILSDARYPSVIMVSNENPFSDVIKKDLMYSLLN